MSRILLVLAVTMLTVFQAVGGDKIRHVSPEMVDRISSATRVEVYVFRGNESVAVANPAERLASEIFGPHTYAGFRVELVNWDLERDTRDRFSRLILDEDSYVVPVEPPPCDSFPEYGFVFIAEADTAFVVVADDCFRVVAFDTDGTHVGGGYAWPREDEWKSMVGAFAPRH
jgi:hypothetical protein